MVDAGKVAGRENGDNPHLWYRPSSVYAVADAVTAELTRLAPADAAYFARRHDAWRASMRPYDEQIAAIARHTSGRSYAATEGIFDDMAHAVGLTDETPRGTRPRPPTVPIPRRATSTTSSRRSPTTRSTCLIYNAQTQGAIPEAIRSRARAAKVPVVNVTESVPSRFRTFAAWQLRQLRDLAAALAA